mmetsp:Transcript_10254/g.38847  ORF Transcript_10254/g.38847 Transcript_10254/m.38847 type:complete len:447 (-) Transcript_10254:881-2221(-)
MSRILCSTEDTLPALRTKKQEAALRGGAKIALFFRFHCQRGGERQRTPRTQELCSCSLRIDRVRVMRTRSNRTVLGWRRQHFVPSCLLHGRQHGGPKGGLPALRGADDAILWELRGPLQVAPGSISHMRRRRDAQSHQHASTNLARRPEEHLPLCSEHPGVDERLQKVCRLVQTDHGRRPGNLSFLRVLRPPVCLFFGPRVLPQGLADQLAEALPEAVYDEAKHDDDQTLDVCRVKPLRIRHELEAEDHVGQGHQRRAAHVQNVRRAVLEDQDHEHVQHDIEEQIRRHEERGPGAARLRDARVDVLRNKLAGRIVAHPAPETMHRVVRKLREGEVHGNRRRPRGEQCENELKQGDPTVQVHHVNVGLAEGLLLVDAAQAHRHTAEDHHAHPERLVLRVFGVLALNGRQHHHHDAAHDDDGPDVLIPGVRRSEKGPRNGHGHRNGGL